MSLSGTFATMPFPELMQWLGDAQRSGTLTVTLEFEERALRLDKGQLTSLGSDDARAHDVAQLALAAGLIDEPRLLRAVGEQVRTRRPMHEVLVAGGHVTAEALTAALRDHAREVVLQLFLWSDGRFVFSDAPDGSLLQDAVAPRPEIAIDPPLSAREILMEGMRRLDEWQRIAELLPSDYTLVHALGRAPDLPALEVLAEAGEPLALGDLYLRVLRPRFRVVEELHQAWRRGLLAIHARLSEVTSQGPATPTEQLMQSAAVLLKAKQFDEAISLLRSAIDIDPYHEPARLEVQRARAAQLEELYQLFPPYKVPVAAASAERIQSLGLTPRERYLLSRLNGKWDVGALTVMTPLGELETLRALKRLRHMGVVTFEGTTPK